jgi:hypothetical protein
VGGKKNGAILPAETQVQNSKQKITKEAYRSRSQTSFKIIRGRFPEGQKSPSRLRIVRAALLIILELLLGIAQLDRVQYIPQNVEQTVSA